MRPCPRNHGGTELRKLLIFCCCLLLILTCLPAGMAATISGRGYEDFELCYADNLDFINQNTGRHLLPLVLAKGEANADGGHRMYELLGDVLRVTIRLDQSNQIIERCEIVLTAPAGMSYGTSEYNDFVTSGYHSYALLMAMHTAADPAVRYGLVTAVNDGLLAGDGTYATQVGVYTLNCTRADNVATLTFENTLAATPEPQATPDGTAPEEEGANEEEGSLAG